MTYSIVARDPRSGQLGVAVQSHYFSVGPKVAWARAGVGAVATQAMVEVSYGPLGLGLMAGGKAAAQALDALRAADSNAAVRQVAMVDGAGTVAAHTGDRAIAEAGHRTGEGFSVQANMMLHATVWDAMADAYAASSAEADLAERLLLALDAAEAEGGDIRGRQSAALLVVSGQPTGRDWEDRLVELRVEDHPEPLAELRRLFELHRAYTRTDRADELLASGDIDRARDEYARSQELSPGNPEMAFWLGVMLANVGRAEEAAEVLALAWGAHPGWAELLRRLPAAGLMPDDAGLLARLLPTS
jgi:uncharacterized Ntn-hydrolase superfamily protein